MGRKYWKCEGCEKDIPCYLTTCVTTPVAYCIWVRYGNWDWQQITKEEFLEAVK